MPFYYNVLGRKPLDSFFKPYVLLHGRARGENLVRGTLYLIITRTVWIRIAWRGRAAKVRMRGGALGGVDTVFRGLRLLARIQEHRVLLRNSVLHVLVGASPTQAVRRGMYGTLPTRGMSSVWPPRGGGLAGGRRN